MSNFSLDDYRILFKKDWHTTELAKDIANIDRKALRDEYKQLIKNAPRRSDKQKYFVCHDGKLSSSEKSNRREEHLAVALWNLERQWPRPDGGWFRLLDYQVPLQAHRSDQGIGKVDLLGLTDQGQLMVIELKVKPDGGSNRGETPVKALMQGLRYAAIVKANREQISSEAKRCFNVDVVAEQPLVQILAPKAWWKGWSDMAGSTREAAGYWEPEFSQFVRDVEKQLGVAVECMSLDDPGTDITCGSDQKTPQLDHAPALYPVRLAIDIDKALPPHRSERQDMTSYATYEEGIRRTLWTWANRYHRCKLDEKHDSVPVLADEYASNNILTPQDESKAEVIRDVISLNQRHRWFRSLKSSQALAQSVFGALHAFYRLDLLQDVRAECGRPAFFKNHLGWTLDFEHEVRCLGEKPRGRTSVDVLLSGPEERIAIECKFTADKFGCCSRPSLSTDDTDYCNGKYQVQRQRHSRCTLTEIGIRYWEHLPHLFDWSADRDHVPCPFKDVYQLARNTLVSALTPDGKPNQTVGHALVVYDARNPEFQVGGEAERQWKQAVAACRMPGLLRRLSWQSLMATVAYAPELKYLVNGVREKYGIEPD